MSENTTESERDEAKEKAVERLNEWSKFTSQTMTSEQWWWELEGIVEEAVEIGRSDANDNGKDSASGVRVNVRVNCTQLVEELKNLMDEDCQVCSGNEWKECGCHVDGIKEGLRIAISKIERSAA